MRIMILLFFALLSCNSYAKVEQFTLKNGLHVLVKEDHRAPVAVTMIWYNVGSADEPMGLSGVSHVLEHMMFKGTQQYPEGEFSKIIAALGGQENAFTHNDYTAYYEKLAAPNLDISFKLEADRMRHLRLDNQAFAKEMQVIAEERRMRTDDNPQALTFERFLATAHLSPPYQHPVIGWMHDIKQMQVTDARNWYKRYYAPNNAVIVVVGDVTLAQVKKLAMTYFGSIKKQPQVLRKKPVEPRALGVKSVTVQAHAQLPMLMMGYTVPSVNSVSARDRTDPYALELVAGILGAGDSGRFMKQLVHNLQVASGVDVYYNLYSRYQTQFIIYGISSRSHTISQLKQQILAEITRLQNQPIPENELKRIKTQVIAQKTFERDSIFGQAMELGLLETIGLGYQTAEQYVARIQAVTAKQVQHVAQQYLVNRALTVAQLIPDNNNGVQKNPAPKSIPLTLPIHPSH